MAAIPGSFGTNAGDVGRVRVLDATCGVCKALVARYTSLDDDLWAAMRAELRANGYVVLDYTAKPSKLTIVGGHRPTCGAVQ